MTKLLVIVFSFLSISLNAGIVVPSIERSQKELNNSPLATIWDERTAFGVAGFYVSQETENSAGSKLNETTAFATQPYGFFSHESISLQGALGVGSGDTTTTSTGAKTDNNIFSPSAFLGVQVTGELGIAFGLVRAQTEQNDGESSSTVKDDTWTMGGAYKTPFGLILAFAYEYNKSKTEVSSTGASAYETDFDRYRLGFGYQDFNYQSQSGFNGEFIFSYETEDTEDGVSSTFYHNETLRFELDGTYSQGIFEAGALLSHYFSDHSKLTREFSGTTIALDGEVLFHENFYAGPSLSFVTDEKKYASVTVESDEITYGLEAGYRTGAIDLSGEIKLNSEEENQKSNTTTSTFDRSGLTFLVDFIYKLP